MSVITIKDGYHLLEDGYKLRASISTDDDKWAAFKRDFEDAKRIANLMHAKQKYGKHPYTYHLSAVAEVLKRFGFNPEGDGDDEHIELCWDLITAAWLHDVVEDTPLSQTEISRRFNPRVSSLVHSVSNPSGGNRAWRAEQVYPRIKHTPHALTLKLGDRIANIEQTLKTKSRLLNMYTKEWSGFHEKYSVLTTGSNQHMWDHLETLFK